MTISNPFSACDQGNAAGKALEVDELTALAATVRTEHQPSGSRPRTCTNTR
jgi:hypothetical protein